MAMWERGSHYKQSRWICFCTCGEYVIVIKCNLTNGDTKSCGCLRRKLIFKHGQSKKGSTTTTYTIWQGIKDRCNNHRNKRYKDYGGRGINVCKRWLRFESFFEDMGSRPEGLSIERIDNNKGYFLGNCKWATQKEQTRNARSNRIIEYNGKSMCLSEWAEILGINRGTLHHRLIKHPPEIAFNYNHQWRV